MPAHDIPYRHFAAPRVLPPARLLMRQPQRCHATLYAAADIILSEIIVERSYFAIRRYSYDAKMRLD